MIHDGKARPAREEGLGKDFRELIGENHQAGQEKEGPAAYVRRLFFSSSDWHLIQKRAYGTARRRF